MEQSAVEAHLEAHPDDKEMWLIYADILETLGHPGSDFIQLEVAITHVSSPQERHALEDKRKLVFEAHIRKMLGFLPDWRTLRCEWHQGFIAKAVFKSQHTREASRVLPKAAARFLRELDIAGIESAGDLRACLSHLRWPSLRTLNLSAAPGLPRFKGDAGLHIPMEKMLSKLGTLSISPSLLGPKGLERLIRSSELRSLHTIKIAGFFERPAHLEKVLKSAPRPLKLFCLKNAEFVELK